MGSKTLIILVAIAAFAFCAVSGRSLTSHSADFGAEKPFFHHYFPTPHGRFFQGLHWPWFWGWPPKSMGARHGHVVAAGNSGGNSDANRSGRSQGSNSQTGTGAIGSLENGGDNMVLGGGGEDTVLGGGGGGDIGQP